MLVTPHCLRAAQAAYLRRACAHRAHCCLQVESLRILLLAEQALREGLDEALARRSAFDLVLSCPGSVPFMHTGLGSPLLRFWPFGAASSSGTCPGREAGTRVRQVGEGSEAERQHALVDYS